MSNIAPRRLLFYATSPFRHSSPDPGVAATTCGRIAALLCFGLSCLFSSDLVAEPSLKEQVARQKEKLTQAIKDRVPNVYPGLIERIDGIFLRYPITQIVLRGFSKRGTKITTDIYIKGEEVYVSQSDEGWNLVANSEGVFEWEKGKANGIKIKRSNEDLTAYLSYLTNPAGILSSIYDYYLASPDKFTIVPNNDKKWKTLELKRPSGGFEALYVSENPLWFHGFKVKDESGQTKEVTISEPKELPRLPEELTQRLKGVKFEDSDLSLKRHMTWL